MQSELETQYGMYEKDAKRAAVLAFERYVNTEDASQYDGIQWAAERYRSSILIEVSRETLPEYWMILRLSSRYLMELTYWRRKTLHIT